jgi:hypothetical protein
MADDALRGNISGVGVKTEQVLLQHGIKTVGDLASLKSGSVPVSNLMTLIERAKQYLAAKHVVLEGVNTDLKPKVTVGIPNTDTPHQVPQECEPKVEDKYLLEDHSWWEMRVVIPCSSDSKGTNYLLQEAIVYELSVESSQRVSFVCSWITTRSETAIQSGQLVDGSAQTDECVCQMTYSPQLLYHFNPTLPALQVTLRQEDWEVLPHQACLNNVLEEINSMRLMYQKVPTVHALYC